MLLGLGMLAERGKHVAEVPGRNRLTQPVPGPAAECTMLLVGVLRLDILSEVAQNVAEVPSGPRLAHAIPALAR